MAFVRKNLSKWIGAAILITIGILCIVSGANWTSGNAGGSLDAISVVLGIVLVVVGGLSLALGIVATVVTKVQFATVALAGALTIALGISLIVAKYAASLILIVLTIIPYALVAIGLVILADSIITLVRGIMAKNTKAILLSAITGIVLGVVSATVGFLCIDFGGGRVIGENIQLIVFGIIVALYGLLLCLASFVPTANVVVVGVKKEEK